MKTILTTALDGDQFTTQYKELLHVLLRGNPAAEPNEVLVTFIKKDGTTRKMPCTLDPRLLPPSPPVDVPVSIDLAELKQTKPVRAKSDEVVAVFATDVQAWRSFRIDSIIKVEVE